MGVINMIKKGMIAARMANETNELNESRILTLIKSYENSDTFKWMELGQKYYEVEQNTTKRKSKSDYLSDNTILHAKYKGLVDEKVSYLLSKPYSLDSKDENYLADVNTTLGNGFAYMLFKLGFESSNKGIGWLHPYIDEKGQFKTMIIPAEQCIPIWSTAEHKELEYMIRKYSSWVWEGNTRKQVVNVEVWSPTGVTYYREALNTLVIDLNKNESGHMVSHYQTAFNEGKVWGKVPFIPFKNNHIEKPDLKFIKYSIDQYDKSRSEVADYVEDAVNYLMAVYGYSSTEAPKLIKQIKDYRMMIFDDKEDGGADVLTPQTDINAIKEHYEQLKRDIVEDGQGVNKDLDKFGSAPSGVALKFMYSGLELKANSMAKEYQEGFDMLLYFVNKYLDSTGKKVSAEVVVQIVFNVDMKTDETETIQNCTSSRGVISDETIVSNHPWATEDELDRIAKQEEKTLGNEFIPLKERQHGLNNE